MCKKTVVFEPFKNPYANNIFLDSDSFCSEDYDVDIASMSLDELMSKEQEVRESIMEWEDFLYDDMNRYEDSSYESDSARSDIQSDRRHIQTLKVELREIKGRIKMMKNYERELVVA